MVDHYHNSTLFAVFIKVWGVKDDFSNGVQKVVQDPKVNGFVDVEEGNV